MPLFESFPSTSFQSRGLFYRVFPERQCWRWLLFEMVRPPPYRKAQDNLRLMFPPINRNLAVYHQWRYKRGEGKNLPDALLARSQSPGGSVRQQKMSHAQTTLSIPAPVGVWHPSPFMKALFLASARPLDDPQAFRNICYKRRWKCVFMPKALLSSCEVCKSGTYQAFVSACCWSLSADDQQSRSFILL